MKWFISISFLFLSQLHIGQTIKQLEDSLISILKEVQTEKNTERIVSYLERFAQQHNVAFESITRFGTQPIEDITQVSTELNQRFQNAVFFASRYVYKEDLNITRFLHSEFSLMVQRRLQNIGTKMHIVPLKLDI